MLNDQDETRSHKRKKKKKDSVPLEVLEGSCSESVNEGGDFNQAGDKPEAKRKRKIRRAQKHRKHPETIITAMLEELNDDVMEAPPRKRGCEAEEQAAAAAAAAAAASPSRQSDSVFVECRNGFSATPRAKLFHPMSDREEGTDTASSASPLALAILVQKYTRPFYTFCHGLLAGMALFHIILVYGAGTKISTFISNYVQYARTYQTLFFFLSVVCTVSMLDRCDLSGFDAQDVSEVFQYGRSSVFAILMYLITVIITSIATLWDDQIALLPYSSNSTMTEYDMQVWRDLNLGRSLAAIAGWIIVAFFPSEDMLHVHLLEMMRYKERNEVTTVLKRY